VHNHDALLLAAAAESQFTVEWLDSGREPKCAPDPAYPDGKTVDAAGDFSPRCTIQVPYPAKRCGFYLIKCQRCGLTAAVTTAGRPDDPRSLTVPCKEVVH
jgi:hypothetical protein